MKELQKQAYEIAKSRGQWENQSIEKVLLHLIEEVIELKKATKRANIGIFEDLLNVGKSYKEAYEFAIKDTIDCEISDVVIFCMSIAEKLGIDLEGAITRKMEYNRQR